MRFFLFLCFCVPFIAHSQIESKGQKTIVMSVYLSSSTDFNNKVIITRSDGKQEKYILMQHRIKEAEINEKKIVGILNDLALEGYVIKFFESSGDLQEILVHTYIFTYEVKN